MGTADDVPVVTVGRDSGHSGAGRQQRAAAGVWVAPLVHLHSLRAGPSRRSRIAQRSMPMSFQTTRTAPRRALAAVVLTSLALLAVGPLGGTASAAPAAAYTSTNPAVDDTGGITLC